MTTKTYVIAAKHSAYGIEGSRVFRGTARGAVRAARRIAKAAGAGWTHTAREAVLVGDDPSKVSSYSTDCYEVEAA